MAQGFIFSQVQEATAFAQHYFHVLRTKKMLNKK